MKEWAKGLYLSTSWINTRNAYMSSQHGLCERCGNGAEIVHHKVHLTPHNVHDVNVTLNWDNLEAICRECHAIEHEGTPAAADGLRFDAMGRLVPRDAVHK